MSVLSIVLLTSVTAFWLFGHLVVRRRLSDLKTNLPDIYHSAIAAPTDDGDAPRLAALAVDLIRKSHCTDPFDRLSAYEQKMALHAHAVEVLPGWMSRYAAKWLRPRDRALITRLHQVKSSQPIAKPQTYNTAIQDHLRAKGAAQGPISTNDALPLP